ncbi:catalase [Shimia gijangensis]|uniref:catalase n=1 Tax=Shimia gijangensis TaxID=1470563 RepID=A0A1M6TQ35_9RHOB|nr:catalase [Shimia gijangensis]SHK59102.1 catalase [Shimia gijangensis]
MHYSDIAKRIVDELLRPDGSKDLRPVHAIGIGATGFFEPSEVAANYCKADHFVNPRTEATLRFSNGSGSKTEHDGWSDVRGMATRFHLSDGTDTDLIMMTLPEFFARTPQEFLDFTLAAKPTEVHWVSPWKKIWQMLHLIPPQPDPYPNEEISPNEGAMKFANANRFSQLAVFQAAGIGAPVSYLRAAYHAVHTFVVTGQDEVDRWVRFNWQPIDGVKNEDPLKTPKDTYLKGRLRDRLADHTSRFTLMMQIGETGDAFDDSTKPWPPHRQRIMMGTLTLNHAAADTREQDEYFEKLSFNPMLLTPGIRASDDPVLHLRKGAYAYSSGKRHANPCPFSGGAENDQ